MFMWVESEIATELKSRRLVVFPFSDSLHKEVNKRVTFFSRALIGR